MPVNSLARHMPDSMLPFCMARSKFKYLGIKITQNFKGLYENNFTSLLTKLKSDFQKWRPLHLSLVGRVNCVKMTVLPRFLYLFQCLPIFLSKAFFSTLDRLISNFIWDGKIPRIGKEFLQKNRNDEGLALPNFLYYYWAANVQKIIYWMRSSEGTDWFETESKSCTATSLQALVTSSLPIKIVKYTSNPVVHFTLKIWTQLRQHFKLRQALLFQSPICNNHAFLPAKLDSAFKQWQDKGISRFSDLYIDGIFTSFNDLRSKFTLNSADLFRYFQIRHFVNAQSSSFPNIPSKSPVDSLLEVPSHLQGLVSRIYIILMSLKSARTDKIRSRWESELSMQFSEEFWRNALYRVNGSTTCARLSLKYCTVCP